MKKTMKHITSTAMPLPFRNVDTDQILPARYLKQVKREGFGDYLFRDWRFTADDKPKKESVFHDPDYKGSKILLTGDNFGAGSSREHAVWSLVDYGFQAVVSSFYADIFKNNALNNRLLPVEVPEDFLQKLFDAVEEDPKMKFIIDVEKQLISVPEKNLSSAFPLNPYKKECFLYGYDDITYLQNHQDEIEAFEKKRKNDFSLV